MFPAADLKDTEQQNPNIKLFQTKIMIVSFHRTGPPNLTQKGQRVKTKLHRELCSNWQKLACAT